MLDWLLTHTAETYAYAYFGMVLIVAVAEWVVPRRRPAETLRLRWLSNFAISILDTLVLRVVFPMATIAWAALCTERGWGLLPAVGWPRPAEFLLTLLVLDFTVYAQHYVLHRVPLLWRLHRTHHSDADYDFTTGIRFHPLESIFTTSCQFLAIYLIGMPPGAVFLAQIVAMIASFVEHANVRLPDSLDRAIRLVFVTPDMHRIHHSQRRAEGQSNFANLFSWWDRLFGTYVEQPSAGHDAMAFGLRQFPGRKHTTLHWMLAQPFLSDSAKATTDLDTLRHRDTELRPS
jgi:sterol desaturase/sphingolipid hydroxylase (fatty acid hydroxylase superfamily)